MLTGYHSNNQWWETAKYIYSSNVPKSILHRVCLQVLESTTAYVKKVD